MKTGRRATPDNNPLQKVIKRIRRVSDFPAISKYLIEINKKLSDVSAHTTASELANIILKDYALTSKLLKLVNSPFYGFVGGKITTVSRAVVLLGYDNIRMAAISLVLFEHFQNKTAADNLKEAVIGSFWCGLMAKEIAKQQNIADKEEAFICAMLHQLGKLMVICHLPRQYREIKEMVTQGQKTEEKAVKRVLGFSYQALGDAVARLWNFPERISKTMQRLPEEALAKKNIPVDPLCALAGFTNELCRIAIQVEFENRDHAIQSLLGRYRNRITISRRQLDTLIESSLENVHKHADALQFSIKDSNFLRNLSGDPKKMATEPPHDSVQRTAEPHPRTGSAFHFAGNEASALPGPDPQDSISTIMDGIQEISAALMEQYEINDVALMSLEIMYRALQCNRVVLFINESRNQTMQARFGYGAGIQQIAGSVGFKPEASNDLFNHAIQANKDLIVDDAEAPDLHVLIPDWYPRIMNAKAFIFLPVVVNQVCIGAFYADFDRAGPPINELEYKYLAMLRNQLILAIKLNK